MKFKKRTKESRGRGSTTHGWGFRQKHKGHGNKGGVGKAGTGKRADHKKQVALESDKKKRYFGKQGLTSRNAKKKKGQEINLRDIKSNLFKKEGEKINLSKYKILGTGIGFKAIITAKSATSSALAKMKKAGGEIVILVNEKKMEKKEVKEELKEEKS